LHRRHDSDIFFLTKKCPSDRPLNPFLKPKETKVTAILDDLKPKAIWEHFGVIAGIPRPSKNEARIAAHVLGLASKAGLEAKQDATGNIVVRKPASPGKERAPIVVIQSHLDMVCEKNREVAHDFDRDPIQLQRANGHIRATGTTLGSDNGIGVAAALAVMLDKTLVHGPLEFLFTVDEETGMTGAMGLQTESLKGRIMLNLDSEEEGSVYVGCAGGRDTVLTFQVTRESIPEGVVPLRIAVRGLKGGHSGVEIHMGRGNAIKVLARTLREVGKQVRFRMASIEGGSKRNAIPREADALVYVRKSEAGEVKNVVARVSSAVQAEYATVDGGVVVEAVPSEAGDKPVAVSDQERIIGFLHTVPHGVMAMSADIPGLVETSTNAATVETRGEAVVIATSQRSSVKTALDTILDQVETLGVLTGAQVVTTGGYPGWKPNLQSPVLAATRSCYEELFGREPVVKAIHAGLECGLIGERFPGMDMVSFGPTIEGAHSPDERVEIATVQKFWDLLIVLLKRLSS
jgi:dipeptidase D